MNTDNLNRPWSVKEIQCMSPDLKEVEGLLYSVVDFSGEEICTYLDEERPQLIVETVNSHASLVERVKELKEALENITDYFEHEMDYPSDNSYIEQARKALQKKEKEE